MAYYKVLLNHLQAHSQGSEKIWLLPSSLLRSEIFTLSSPHHLRRSSDKYQHHRTAENRGWECYVVLEKLKGRFGGGSGCLLFGLGCSVYYENATPFGTRGGNVDWFDSSSGGPATLGGKAQWFSREIWTTSVMAA